MSQCGLCSTVSFLHSDVLCLQGATELLCWCKEEVAELETEEGIELLKLSLEYTCLHCVLISSSSMDFLQTGQEHRVIVQYS